MINEPYTSTDISTWHAMNADIHIARGAAR